MSNAFHRYVSPLRYPGGKAQVANFMKVVLLENELVGCRYVEPYAGGASVALSLLYEDFVSSVHINDLNPGVYDFWHSALYDTADFCDLIRTTPLTVNEWRYQRDVAASDDASNLERGFATFYLNRTNRSGIISGGLIGGLDQAGPWKMDARFPRTELIRRIEKIGRFGSRITVTRQDTLELLSTTPAAETDDRFYFLDPPYYARGHRLYDNFYKHEDHQKIHDVISNLSDYWIVSYDAAPEIMRIYDDCQPFYYSLSYIANTRSRGNEVMFSASSVRMPSRMPMDISTEDVHGRRLQTVAQPFA